MDYVVQPLLWPELSKDNKNLPKYTENVCEPYKHEFTSSFSAIIKEAIKETLDIQSKGPLIHLPPSPSFKGGGIYALYYQPPDKEGFSGYFGLSPNTPLYVGKTVNSGWRANRTKKRNDSRLYGRLRHHANNIHMVSNLSLNHFVCQFTILKDINLIVLVEAEMIRTFSPLWNTTVDGFGNNMLGKRRKTQTKSSWDTLHPGRKGADKCKDNPSKTKEQLLAEIDAYIYKQSRSI